MSRVQKCEKLRCRFHGEAFSVLTAFEEDLEEAVRIIEEELVKSFGTSH